MILIPVYHRGKIRAWTVIDPEDFCIVGQVTWRLSKKGYATRSVTVDGHEYREALHQVVTRWVRGSGLVVDHRNGNKLDNRRKNLRIVTPLVNLHNRGPSKTTKSGVRGVYWDKDRRLWRAEVNIAGIRHRLGRYPTIEEAAKAVESVQLPRG